MKKGIPYGLFCLTWLAVLFTGCEKVVDFPNVMHHQPVPVIEAVFTNEMSVQKVKVSYSVSLDDSLSCLPVEDAIVRVISDEGDTLHFLHDSCGWYNSPLSAAKPGIVYTLEVEIKGTTYKSSGQVMEMNGIDSLYCSYSEKTNLYDEGYYVYMNAGPANKKTSYYLINAFCNDTLKTTGSEIWIFNDDLVDDLNDIKLPMAFSKNDTVTIELYSLSKAMFDYHYKLAYEVLNLNLSNISYRTNPPQLFTPRALGYFQVSAVSRKEMIIR
jgi:hypothetical protein